MLTLSFVAKSVFINADLFHFPSMSAPLADADFFLFVNGLWAAPQGAPQQVPPAEEDEPQQPPPPADEQPPQAAMLRFFKDFIYYADVDVSAAAFWTDHDYSPLEK